jgi:hypothetical protein
MAARPARREVVTNGPILCAVLLDRFHLHCANLGVGRRLRFPEDFFAQRQIKPVGIEVGGDLLTLLGLPT